MRTSEGSGPHFDLLPRVRWQPPGDVRPAEGTGGFRDPVNDGRGQQRGMDGRRSGDVLTLAGLRGKAVSVLQVALDAQSPEAGFRYSLPVEKAMHPDTLLAYSLNGETLPRDHGFPLRAMVPGWAGCASIKWLGRIHVSSEQLWTRNNTTSYVLIGDQYSPEGEALGERVAEQVIKSALALPWPAEMAAGTHRIAGYAHSPSAPIARVEWSVDSGRTRKDADSDGRAG